MTERLPGAEAARRNDLAMDVARLWQATRRTGWWREFLTAMAGQAGGVPADLAAALDRLAEAYDFNAAEEQ